MVFKLTVRQWSYAVSLILLVVCIYLPVKDFSFLNFDDNIYVYENPHIVSGLSWENFVWAFTDSRGGHWHPLTWVAHMINVSMFGLDPGKHHAVNVCFHAMNTVLTFLILQQLTGATLYAFSVAILVGLHPMRLESVVWISELKDVLSLFFLFLSMLVYVNYVRHQNVYKYTIFLLLFALGLMAKPTILTLPLLLVLIDVWPLKRISFERKEGWRVCLLEKIPLLLLSFGSVVVTSYFQDREGSVVSFETLSLWTRIQTTLVSYVIYIKKLFFPLELGIFYPLRTYNFFTVGISTAVLIIISWLCFRNCKARPYLCVGWLWFLISLSPVIGMIQFGGQAYADRWSYLPYVGLVFSLVWLLKDQRILSPALIKVTAVVLFSSSLAWTSLQLPHWRDSIAIFSHTLEISPNNFMAHTNLGAALDASNRFAEAIPHYEEAYRLNPTYPEAINNLGLVRARAGNFKEAAQLFTRALEIRPDFLIAKANRDLAISRLNQF